MILARRAVASLASLLPLGACSPTRLANALTRRGDVEQEADVAYGPLARHRLDLYRPAGLRPRAPLLVFFFGGGWVTGARSDYAFAAVPLAKLGCAVAVPDYRLWPEAGWPGFVEDGALAVAHLARREAGRPVLLMGHSAGAFIAASLALDPHWSVRGLVDGFVGLAGPYDFGAEEVTPPAIFAETPRAMAAPDGVDLRGGPRLLLLHGTDDVTVGPYHSRILAARARAAGVAVRHVEYAGMGHVGIVAALAAPVRALGLAGGDVLGEVAGFVQSLVQVG
jgi:acetyl esterase/lipase